MTRKILLIGGGGFIGLHLAKALIASGREVIILGRLESIQSGQNDNFVYFSSLKISRQKLNELLLSADEIIYLAYSSVPQSSYLEPLKDISENLSLAVEMFNELKKSNVKKLVYVSSGGTVYGQAQDFLIDENHPTNPISPYGITKLAIEKYGLMFLATSNLPFVIVRPSNPYGEAQLPFKGQGFISTAIASGIIGEKVKVFGEFGTIRDYIYVDDLISGLISVLDFGKIGEIYNLGTGIGTTNLELINFVNEMANETGLLVEHEIVAERPFDVRSNVLNSCKLKRLNGWEAKVELKDGLKRTISWFRSKNQNELKHYLSA